jgi:hypothetical protein
MARFEYEVKWGDLLRLQYTFDIRDDLYGENTNKLAVGLWRYERQERQTRRHGWKRVQLWQSLGGRENTIGYDEVPQLTEGKVRELALAFFAQNLIINLRYWNKL